MGFYCNLYGGSTAVYKLAGKEGGSDIARRTDITIYSLSFLQKSAIENASLAKKEIAARRHKLQAEVEENGDECDSVLEVYSQTDTYNDEAKQNFKLKSVKRYVAELLDSNFNDGDVWFTGTLDRIHVDNHRECVAKFVKDFRRWYKETFGVNPKWVWICAYGDINDRVHYHFFIGVERDFEAVKKAIAEFWVYGNSDTQQIRRNLGELCVYCAEQIEKRRPYARCYGRSKGNLVEPVKSKPQSIEYREYKHLFDVVDSAETVQEGLINLATEIEALPQMAGRRVTNLQVNRFDDIQPPLIAMTVMNVMDDVQAGNIGLYRSRKDLEYFQNCNVRIIGRIDERVYIGDFADREFVNPEEPYFQTRNYVWHKPSCNKSNVF